MTADSAGAAAFAATWRHLLAGMFAELPADHRPSGGDRWFATFENQTIGRSGLGLIEDRFNRGPYPADGSSAVVNATGWDADGGYEVTALPSLRMIVDLGDVSRSRGVHVPGQSGHAYHAEYTSMVPRWLDGEQHDMPWSTVRARQQADSTLRLRPE